MLDEPSQTNTSTSKLPGDLDDEFSGSEFKVGDDGERGSEGDDESGEKSNDGEGPGGMVLDVEDMELVGALVQAKRSSKKIGRKDVDVMRMKEKGPVTGSRRLAVSEPDTCVSLVLNKVF